MEHLECHDAKKTKERTKTAPLERQSRPENRLALSTVGAWAPEPRCYGGKKFSIDQTRETREKKILSAVYLTYDTTTAWSLSKMLALFFAFFFLTALKTFLFRKAYRSWLYIMYIVFIFLLHMFILVLLHWIFKRATENRFYLPLAKSGMHSSHWALFGVRKDIPENSTEEFHLQCSGSTILWLGTTQVMAAEA